MILSQNMANKVITIDGLSSSGKSTLSRHLAKKLKWNWMSTGVIYRGIAYVGKTKNFSDKEYEEFVASKDWKICLSQNKTCFFYKKQDLTDKLYSPEIDEAASCLSSRATLRKKLIPLQRSFSEQYPEGLIAEGRDCGTMIFKEAPLKVYLKANEAIRASRRFKDRKQNENQTLKNQKERDERDKTRSFAPAIKPEGSLEIDTKIYNIEEMVVCVYSEACKKGLHK